MNLFHTLTPFYLRCISLIFPHLILGLKTGLLLSSFPPKFCTHLAFLHACYKPTPISPSLILIILTIWRRLQFMKLPKMWFSPASYISSLLGSKYLHQQPFSYILLPLNFKTPVNRSTGSKRANKMCNWERRMAMQFTYCWSKSTIWVMKIYYFFVSLNAQYQ